MHLMVDLACEQALTSQYSLCICFETYPSPPVSPESTLWLLLQVESQYSYVPLVDRCLDVPYWSTRRVVRSLSSANMVM